MSDVVFQALVFPGLLYVLVWTVGLFWFFRKFMAALHKRVGPSFNGKGGSYQTLFDLSKLLTKELKIRSLIYLNLLDKYKDFQR